MSSRIPKPCDATIGGHDGELRFYTTGWKCWAHRPGATQCPRCSAPIPPNSGGCKQCGRPVGH